MTQRRCCVNAYGWALIPEGGSLDALVARGENSVSHIDALLLSPALAHATAGITPAVERVDRALPASSKTEESAPSSLISSKSTTTPIRSTSLLLPTFPRGDPELYASDHCSIFLEIPD